MKKFIFIITFLLFATNLFAEDIIVIVNELGPLIDISKAEIKDIYLGNIKIVKGVMVIPLHYSEGDTKDAFLTTIVGKTSKEYRLHWTKKLFQEGGAAPVSQKSFPLIVLSVRNIKGVIGYLPKSELGDVQGVRIITTINHP